MSRRGVVDLEWIALSLQAQAKTLSGQVAILEAHVELLIDRLADQQTDPLPIGNCPHPDEARMEAGTMRASLRFFCKACRRFVDPARATDDRADGPRSSVDVPS